nr:MAG TPA: hypothetical protein [Caudoviricetes sp.]
MIFFLFLHELYDKIIYSQANARRDSLVVVPSGNGKENSMNTMEILTLILVIFTVLTYIDSHHK